MSTCCRVLAAILALTVAVLLLVLTVLRPDPAPPDYSKLPIVADTGWPELTPGDWQYLMRTGRTMPSIASHADAPVSPAQVLQMPFLGTQPDTEPMVYWHPLPAAKEVYVEYDLKIGSTWQCNPAGCGKVSFLFAPQGGDTYMGIYCPPSSGNPYGSCGGSTTPAYFVAGGQLQFLAGAGANYPLGYPLMPNKITTPIYRDRWHHWALYYRWSSSPTADDGIWRWWIDGVLNGEYTDIVYSIDGAIEFQFAMTKQIEVTDPQFAYYDHTILRAPGGGTAARAYRKPTPHTMTR